MADGAVAIAANDAEIAGNDVVAKVADNAEIADGTLTEIVTYGVVVAEIIS